MDAIYVKYSGDGFLPGVPARDLTREEYDALTDELKADVQASKNYQVVGGTKKSKAADASSDSVKETK